MQTEQRGFRKILAAGLWQENPGLVQLLGLCPLLAVSNTLVNGLGLGIATLAVLCATNLLVSATRGWLHPDLRLPAFVLMIATFVTAVDLTLHAWFFELHGSLGIFVPLIVTNCVILGRAEAFASRNTPSAALADGLAQGLGFAAVLTSLGGVRELLGQGSLFAGAQMLFGPGAESMQLRLLSDGNGLLLAMLPPGAFIGLALMLAMRNWLNARRSGTAVAAAREEQA